MGQERDYYSVLGVSPQASADELHRAYRELVRQYHPDTHPHDEDAERHFKAITEAYRTLSDPEQRMQYDAQLASAQQPPPIQEQPMPQEAPTLTREDVEAALNELSSVVQAAVDEAAVELRSYVGDLSDTLDDISRTAGRGQRPTWDRRRFPPPPPPPPHPRRRRR